MSGPGEPPQAVQTWIEDRLSGEIERVLRSLEAIHAAGIPLPADDVRQAVILIRLYAESPSSRDAWIDREGARRIANLLKTKRLIGSLPFQRPKFRVSELAATTEPEGIAITLFDVVK